MLFDLVGSHNIIQIHDNVMWNVQEYSADECLSTFNHIECENIYKDFVE